MLHLLLSCGTISNNKNLNFFEKLNSSTRMKFLSFSSRWHTNFLFHSLRHFGREWNSASAPLLLLLSRRIFQKETFLNSSKTEMKFSLIFIFFSVINSRFKSVIVWKTMKFCIYSLSSSTLRTNFSSQKFKFSKKPEFLCTNKIFLIFRNPKTNSLFECEIVL